MKNRFQSCIQTALLLVASLAAFGGDASAQHLVDKKCGRCGASVGLAAAVGQNCPHCGAFWGAARERYVHAPESPSEPSAQPEPRSAARIQSPSGDYTLEQTADGRFIKILDQAGDHILTLPHEGQLLHAMFSPQEDGLLTVSGGGAWLFDLSTGRRRLRVSETGTCSARFISLPSGPAILVAKERLIYFKDLNGKLILNRVTARSGRTYQEAIVRSDSLGTRIFTVETDGWTQVHDLAPPSITAAHPARIAGRPSSAP